MYILLFDTSKQFFPVLNSCLQCFQRDDLRHQFSYHKEFNLRLFDKSQVEILKKA